MYDILHELPNELKLWTVGKGKMLAKLQNCMGTHSGLPCKNNFSAPVFKKIRKDRY